MQKRAQKTLNTPSEWLPLQGILESVLFAHTDGVSEYDLLKILQSSTYKVFSRHDLQDPLVLFQTHFIVFNALYHLRDKLIKQQLGLLHIDCMNICIKPWRAGGSGLQAQDKLREYYLNWQHLSDTGQQEVESLLNSFWQGFSGKIKQNNNIELEQALNIFEIKEVISQQQIKKQYRKLLHKHHPDKGGDNENTQLLHKAFECLYNYSS
ncbi:DnaJ domain-containing protein [Paraglaciecola aquimarina]|uniref:DnaJ domain-containing protein n=1 Tax=Paraglaciecola algarum TaxID=3050085 RepID=A0ABS9D7M8_9ALTE|nr:DNA-J related domain-containing protein [Paraglaciecola sp. G1-23]MCF2948963.1 DnaJ domain-containing protein [Paraglaciecola sp. G1-23]